VRAIDVDVGATAASKRHDAKVPAKMLQTIPKGDCCFTLYQACVVVAERIGRRGRGLEHSITAVTQVAFLVQ
jgi:hypothetical protein